MKNTDTETGISIKFNIIRDSIMERINSDNDAVVSIDGREGSGKSTLALLIAQDYHKKMNLPFSLQKNVVYTGMELKDKLFLADKKSCIVVDEGSRIFYKRNSMKRDQIELVDLMQQVRFKNLFFIICIPNFRNLDKYFREDRCFWWIHVLRRGIFDINKIIPQKFGSTWIEQSAEILNWEPIPKDDKLWKDYVFYKEEAFMRQREEDEKQGIEEDEDILTPISDHDFYTEPKRHGGQARKNIY